ncbi:MAG: glycosyltransferase family 2 protein [Deltaproteobacteria bacterium]|nr:glycosyltransferase family 2 protein [Deltaproteobacteria bacterium]
MADVELTIVMPCLNEAETLEKCIVKAMNYLARAKIDGEVVIGDNGSTDGSQEIARKAGARVVDVPRRGYGAAIMGAVEAARGKYVIMGDSDDSYDFSNLDLYVQKLREGNDLVMGNRFKGGIQPGAMPFLHKYLGNPVLSFIGRLFFKSDIGDFHCGLRGFRQDLIARLGLQTTGMEFASEMVVKATLFKCKIAEVPTTLAPDGRSRPPHLRTWRDGWRHLRFLLIFSPRWLFIIPGLILSLLGLVVGGIIIHGPFTLGPATFDTNTLLYAGTAVVIGFQALVFGLITRVYGMVAGFLPPRPSLEKYAQQGVLERGLVVGLTIFVVGVALSIYAVLKWRTAHYGMLVYTDILRVVIPSAVAVIVGLQIVLGSFFLSVLLIKHK